MKMRLIVYIVCAALTIVYARPLQTWGWGVDPALPKIYPTAYVDIQYVGSVKGDVDGIYYKGGYGFQGSFVFDLNPFFGACIKLDAIAAGPLDWMYTNSSMKNHTLGDILHDIANKRLVQGQVINGDIHTRGYFENTGVGINAYIPIASGNFIGDDGSFGGWSGIRCPLYFGILRSQLQLRMEIPYKNNYSRSAFSIGSIGYSEEWTKYGDKSEFIYSKYNYGYYFGAGIQALFTEGYNGERRLGLQASMNITVSNVKGDYRIPRVGNLPGGYLLQINGGAGFNIGF